MPRPEQIQQAIRNVTDQRSFIDGLLHQTLNWPIDLNFENIGDISYEWTDDELNAAGLSRSILTGPVLQMQSLIQNQSWGIFILEFTNPDALITGRGLTGPLRKVLRGLVPKRRGGRSNLPNWERENLLFICTHNYQHFRFAYFKPAKQKGQAEPLAIFGWDSGDAALRTLCEYNLPFLVWSDNLQQPQWRDAFNIEKVTKGFYSQVAKLFADLIGGSRKQGSKTYQGKNLLILPSSQSDTVRKEFAVRLIGRLVFCWFLKKKKSEDGLPLVPEELLSTKSINNKGIGGYYHSILEPLFFEVLNTPEDERNKQFKKAPWSIIPFLNGGLFTPHEDDFYKLTFNGISEHLNDLIIPDNLIRELFEVFETYNFTIEESTPLDIEVAVDPEILGRIFENLLAEINPETGETARKATGSYYTPRPIVEYMVDEGLKQYLLTRTSLSETKIASLLSYTDEDPSLLDSQKEEVLNALDTIQVIDPACGSGAFPMGILQKILLILQKIDPDSQKWLSKILAKIENATVRTELAKKLKDASLDYVHKLGIIQSSIYGVDIQPIAIDISKLRCFLSLIVDEIVDDVKKNRGIEPLPNLEFKFICANTLIGLPKKETTETKKSISKYGPKEYKDQNLIFEAADQIKELKELREKYLGSYGKEKKQIEARFREVQGKMFEHALDWGGRETQTLKLSQWNPFSDEPCHWFDPEWMFGIKDGFNVVIANPPYVVVSQDKLKGYYLTKGNNNTYVAFIEAAKKHVNPCGTIAYIIPTTWMAGNNFLRLRKDLLQNKSIRQILQLPYDVFDAYIDNVILILNGQATKNDTVKTFRFNVRDEVEGKIKFEKLDLQDWLSDNEQVIFLNKELLGILKKYRHCRSRTLGSIARVQRGTLPPKKNEMFTTDTVDNNRVLIPWFSHQVYRYVIKEELEFKIDYHRLRENKPLELFKCEKILARQLISRKFRLQLTYYNKVSAFKKNLYAIYDLNDQFNYFYLLAILNSRFYSYVHVNLNASGQRDDYPYFSLKDFRNFLIPDIEIQDQKPFATIVSNILDITNDEDFPENGKKKIKVEEYDRQIDQMVYRLYDLTPEEIAIVENS